MNNFFDYQEDARRATRYLFALFTCAVAATICTFYAICIAALNHHFLGLIPLWQPYLLLAVCAIVVPIVSLASVQKMRSLHKQGGRIVPESMGGVRAELETNDPNVRQLLNVVEEMAIAAGVAVPTIYILPYEGINALVAGFNPNEAALAVSEGATKKLSRSGLQGLIAHQFSHIVNGDMALNLKMLGLLHGLLVVHLTGQQLIISTNRKKRTSLNISALLNQDVSLISKRSKAKRHRSRYSRETVTSPIQLGIAVKVYRNTAFIVGALAPLSMLVGTCLMIFGAGRTLQIGEFLLFGGMFLLGFVLVGLPILGVVTLCGAFAAYVAGSVGLLFAQSVKIAIVKQRKFLADAAAVQFTRDPAAVVNALHSVSTPGASLVSSPVASTASHLFFSSVSGEDTHLLSVHPSITHRITRIRALIKSPQAIHPAQPHRKANTVPAASLAQHPPANRTEDTHIGTITALHLATAQSLIETLPSYLLTVARSQVGAVAIVYALLLSHDKHTRAKQTQIIFDSSETVAELLTNIEPVVASLNVRLRLPLLELCIPSLKTLKPTVAAQLFKRVKALVSADHKLSLSEYALQTVLQYRLAPHFHQEPPQKTYSGFSDVWNECLIVISAIAYSGHSQPERVKSAFRAGLAKLPASRQSICDEPRPCALPDIGRALVKLRQLTPSLKSTLAQACVQTALLDSKINDKEAEILRAILIPLGCPVPPFV